jgi:endonuclease I
MKNFFRILFITALPYSFVPYSYSQYEPPIDYYESTDGLYGEDLKSALHDIIKDHQEFSYSSSSSGWDTWDILKVSDKDPNNSNNVYLIYTGNSLNGSAEYNSGRGWNREHIWPRSLGGFNTSQGPGTDVHNLRASNIRINSSRSNKEFDYGGQAITVDGATETYADEDSFEPNDSFKGDVARAIFYMAVRYEGGSGEPDLELSEETDGVIYLFGKISTLLDWHNLDPVDNFERRRNEVIYSYQSNRNPFIDNPELASAVFDPNYEPEPLDIFKDYSVKIIDNKFVFNFTALSSGYNYMVERSTDLTGLFTSAPEIRIIRSRSSEVPPKGYSNLEFSVPTIVAEFFMVKATAID